MSHHFGRAVATPITTLVDALIAEQTDWTTAVDHFARWHERRKWSGHDQEPLPHYQRLVPLARPGAGEQYAFEVDLSRCTGCKACVAACHSLNGLDDTESWRQVGELIQAPDEAEAPRPTQTITTACHHCEDPACANGCPVLAYEKDPATGIVRHLDDQCIGCSYCILKCPYDVPKYNQRRGIVRKCDMCHQRLSAGEAPACVQACPTSAIAIRVVPVGVYPPPATRLLPGAFPSDYTRPTTRFIGFPHDQSAKPQPADHSSLSLDPAHPPLTLLLVMTQMGTGGFAFAAAAASLLPRPLASATLVTTAALAALIGLAASLLHLGQPWKAWRVCLGWRKSWLSREAILFGAFGGIATAATVATHVFPGLVVSPALLWMTSALGFTGVAASAMVYIDTRRPFWSARLVSGKFAATTVVLGALLAAAVWGWQGAAEAWLAAGIAFSAQAAMVSWEIAGMRRALANPHSAWHRSALTLYHRQPRLLLTRLVLLAATAGLILAGMRVAPTALQSCFTAAWLTALASHLIERHQFFTACAGPRMPGLA
ncbi:MAG: DmsC/YnfH family molybdoenzyme membrane anchor subunit [Verrucomicrobiales bacterium]